METPVMIEQCPHGFSSAKWCDECMRAEDEQERVRAALLAQAQAEAEEAAARRQAMKEAQEAKAWRPSIVMYSGKCDRCSTWATTPPRDTQLNCVEVKLTDQINFDVGTETADVLVTFVPGTDNNKLSIAAEFMVTHFFAFNRNYHPSVDYKQKTIRIQGPLRKDKEHSITAIARSREVKFEDGSTVIRIHDTKGANW